MFKLKFKKSLESLDSSNLKNQLIENFKLVGKAIKERKIITNTKLQSVIETYLPNDLLKTAFNTNSLSDIKDKEPQLKKSIERILSLQEKFEKINNNNNSDKKEYIGSYARRTAKFKKIHNDKAKKLWLAGDWKSINIWGSIKLLYNKLKSEPGYFESILTKLSEYVKKPLNLIDLNYECNNKLLELKKVDEIIK